MTTGLEPTTQPWPKEMELATAIHDMWRAIHTVRRAIEQAETWPELRQLSRECEQVRAACEALSSMALQKADRL